MKKNIIIIAIVIIAVGTLFIFRNINNNSKSLEIQKQIVKDNNEKAEKIEVVHFHAAQQCWSCITVGKYALKTIEEKFPEEYRNGAIIFKDINAESSENNEIVMKYQARGSSLFVNAVVDGKDNIEEDVSVWRLVSNESQFINYFQNKLSSLLKK